MTTIFRQSQVNLIHPYLSLELESAGRRTAVKAIIDTGFSDYLVINKKVCKLLFIKSIGKVEIELGNSLQCDAKICNLRLRLLDLPELVEIELEALILPVEEDVLIGSKLLEKLGKELEVGILFNYLESGVEFVKYN